MTKLDVLYFGTVITALIALLYLMPITQDNLLAFIGAVVVITFTIRVLFVVGYTLILIFVNAFIGTLEWLRDIRKKPEITGSEQTK